MGQERSTLVLTEGKGDDMEEDEENDEVEEKKFEKEEPIRKKGKVFIMRPKKLSTIVFTRRTSKSRKKLNLGKENAKKII